MAIVYVSPTGSGDKSGSSAANAKSVGGLDAAIQQAGPGGTVYMLADKGTYTASDIAVSHGGTASAPVMVMGVSSSGLPMDITINGTRDPTWTVGEANGNYVFKLYAGANNIIFDGFDFNNVGMGFMLAGDLQNVTIQNMEANNVRYFIGNYAGGGSTTASVDGLTIRNIEVHGYSKSVVLLKYDTRNVLIDNVYGDSEGQVGDLFAMGIMLTGTVHDVVIKNSTMMNNKTVGGSTEYWNGDGFVTERGVYNVRFENTVSKGNTDGGYDLKSSNTTLVNAVAEDNGRNYRLWGTNVELINPTGIDPHQTGGTTTQSQIWVSSTASVKVTGGSFADSGSATKAVVSDGGQITFSNTNFWYAGTALTYGSNILGINSSLIHKVGATGTYSTDGETLLPAVSPPPPPPPPATTDVTLNGTSDADVLTATSSGNWTVSGLAGTDTITTSGGADVVTGGAGDDAIATGAGDDIIKFGGTAEGYDAVDGGLGLDRIVATANGTVIGLRSVTGVEQISSGGFSSVTIRGSAAGDVLDFSSISLSGITAIKGGAGNDTINGSAAADVISGGTGADTLRGGGGPDRFDFNSTSESTRAAPDRVLDFTPGVDRLDLAGIDARSTLSGDQAFRFLGEAAFTGRSGELRIDRSDPLATSVMADLNGDRVADFVIILAGSHSLSSADFIL